MVLKVFKALCSIYRTRLLFILDLPRFSVEESERKEQKPRHSLLIDLNAKYDIFDSDKVGFKFSLYCAMSFFDLFIGVVHLCFVFTF